MSWSLSLSLAKQMVRIGAISSIVALYWTIHGIGSDIKSKVY
jgi:hypothetical protein